MGKVSRRRTKTTAVATAAAVIGIMSTSCAVASRRRRHHHRGAAASSSSSSSTAAHATAITGESSSSSSLPLGTVFSCGSHWTKATTCSTLCPSGDDHQCPLGESCFAGIPCDTTGGEGGSTTNMKEILQHQSQLEQQEMNRLVEEREGMFVNRYVCGESYLEAEESCNDFDGDGDGPSLGEDGSNSSSSSGSMDDGFTTTADSTNGLNTATTPTAAHYCPTGSSSQCPPTMKCYAAVSCPRHLHDPEPSLMMMDQTMVVTQPTISLSTLTLSPSSSATAPTTASTPTEDDDGSRESSRMDDSWSSYIRESSLSSMVVSGISSLLFSSSSCGGGPDYGLN